MMDHKRLPLFAYCPFSFEFDQKAIRKDLRKNLKELESASLALIMHTGMDLRNIAASRLLLGKKVRQH